jgi:hypothetical protein
MANERQAAHSLIGLILEKENVLTAAQVHGILAQQRALRTQGKVVAFGQVALDMRLVTPPQLQRALQLQAKLAVPPGAPKPLGFYLIEAGLVSPSQLQRGLELQAKDGGRIGEVLVAQGWLAPTMLEMFLTMQRKDRAANPAGSTP